MVGSEDGRLISKVKAAVDESLKTVNSGEN